MKPRVVSISPFALALLASIAFALSACGGDDAPPDETGTEDVGGQDAGGEDSGADEDAEGDASPGEDTQADGSSDAGDEDADAEEPFPETPCERDRDCAEGGICLDELCRRAPPCFDLADWNLCRKAIDEIVPGAGEHATCHERRCRVSCVLDSDCADGEACTDFGFCLPYSGDLDAPLPGGEDRADLEVGYDETMLSYPIGLPLAGFGERAAFNDGRYAESLRATAGQVHGLFARTIVMDNGESELMLMRLPIIFPTMGLYERVAARLAEETGRNWRDNLVISATHTHSGPARYWNLPRGAALPLGTFGTGEYSMQAQDWLVESLVESALGALESKEPARFGWKIIEGFDTDDNVGSDRWDQTPPFDDNRTLLFRIDDLDGTPRVVLFSFGAHGTSNNSDYFTGDVLWGAERELEMALGREFGRHIPTMFVNQNSGTMAPAGGVAGHRFPQSIERMGWAFVERVWDELLSMETKTDVGFRSRTTRFPLTYEMVGYEPDEFASSVDPPIGGQYSNGAVSCAATRNWSDEEFDTFAHPGTLECIAIHFLINNRTPTIFTKSQITAMEIDGLTVLTMPGELAMELSWQILRELRDQFDVDPLQTWSFGYAQAHLLYLLPTNLRGELPPFPGISTPMPPDDYPDFAFSFLQGGYEASLAPWGPKQGDFLVERAAEAYGRLLDPDLELDFEQPLPAEYSPVEEDEFVVDETDSAVVGTFTADVPDSVTRLDWIEFSWIGGDPGAEMPQAPRVTLEREVDGTFEEILLDNFRTYDNREHTMLTRVRAAEQGWEWIARWEELKDFPVGTYRFRIDGHYRAQGADRDDRTPYQVTTSSFELVARTDLALDPRVDGESLTLRPTYPPGQRMFFSPTFTDPGAVTGSFRLRHPNVPLGVADPAVADDDLDASGVSVTFYDGDDQLVAEATPEEITVTTAPQELGGRSGVPVTTVTVPLPAGEEGAVRAEITVTDSHGNTGSADLDL